MLTTCGTTTQSMPSPRLQYEFRGGFGGRAASSAAPMNRTRERALWSPTRRRGGEAPQTPAHLMLPGGPCTQSDEDLMTIRSVVGPTGRRRGF